MFHHSGISARGLGVTCRLGKDQNHLVLIGPHVRSCWFGGRANLYGHLRRVTPGEGNRLGWDERRQREQAADGRG